MSKSVRAKFTVVSYTTQEFTREKRGPKGERLDGPVVWEKTEVRTIHLHPVYGNGDPEHENTKFWNASPSGRIELGTVNPEAWEAFVLGKSYFIDFIPAE